jgi:hypothetical protein
MRLLTILVVAGALVMAGPALAGKKNKGNGNNGKSNQPSTTEQILTKAVVGGLITLAERAIIGDYVASHRSQFAGAQALPPGIAKKVARGGALGTDVLIVEVATGVIVDVLKNAL